MAEITTPPVTQIRDLEQGPGPLKPTVIKKSEAYFGTMVRNRNKNDYRTNDNYFKHISSVGDESDIQQEHTKRLSPCEQVCDYIEQHLRESDATNWLLFMENEHLHTALLTLSEMNRRLTYMLYAQKPTQAECAMIMGITQGAVAQRHSYIKKVLRKNLQT